MVKKYTNSYVFVTDKIIVKKHLLIVLVVMFTMVALIQYLVFADDSCIPREIRAVLSEQEGVVNNNLDALSRYAHTNPSTGTIEPNRFAYAQDMHKNRVTYALVEGGPGYLAEVVAVDRSGKVLRGRVPREFGYKLGLGVDPAAGAAEQYVHISTLATGRALNEWYAIARFSDGILPEGRMIMAKTLMRESGHLEGRMVFFNRRLNAAEGNQIGKIHQLTSKVRITLKRNNPRLYDRIREQVYSYFGIEVPPNAASDLLFTGRGIFPPPPKTMLKPVRSVSEIGAGGREVYLYRRTDGSLELVRVSRFTTGPNAGKLECNYLSQGRSAVLDQGVMQRLLSEPDKNGMSRLMAPGG
ncbi:MAG: hypothetical protein A2583_09945 [Bdellovibrionales bacterium RIFOXYD1_FULL_53_11]|nr:MAG: hypothetical protein A2583_09945 [Bdellovibrionales bacterium RIFOXYD1_FULL_53_11]